MKKHSSSPSFLIVSLRYIGDVLLSTPLALSIKEQLPEAQVDYLVFEGTDGILQKNPYVRSVLTIPSESKNILFYTSLWNRYDYAIGTNPSDRTAFYCACGGRQSVGFSYLAKKEWWKKLLLNKCNFYNDQIHIVPLILSQIEFLGVPPKPRVVVGYDDNDEKLMEAMLGKEDYILLHPYARKQYKYWPAASWAALADMIQSKLGIRTVFTVSPDHNDKGHMDAITASVSSDILRFPKSVSLSQLAAALKNSKAYIGVDTVVTHMAAALDVPMIALFGPSLVRHFGPWPNDYSGTTPYGHSGRVQRIGRITVVQKNWSCVPCNQEICSITNKDQMECMTAITAEEVLSELIGVMQTAPLQETGDIENDESKG
jgi:heptosyltransferase-3